MAERILPPQSMEVLKRFLETEDISHLSKPIVFSKKEKEYANWLFCQALAVTIPTVGIPILLCPYGTCCTSYLVPHVDMQLDFHAVQVHDSENDCCCHIRTEKKTIPLNKIQDVQVDQGCAETCYGVKILTILTGGEGGESSTFLDTPDDVRTAIMLAVRLAAKADPASPMLTNSMYSGDGVMAQRLKTLSQLVERGVLTSAEVTAVRVQVLAAEHDPTQMLLEAADLRDTHQISAVEMDNLKALLLARLRLSP